MTWFFPIALAFSLSLRTAYIQPNPLDYQILFSAQKKQAAIIEYEYQRENGKLYTRVETNIRKNYQNFIIESNYKRNDINDYAYHRTNLGYQHGAFTIGYSLRHDLNSGYPSHSAVLGWNIYEGFNLLVISAKTDLSTQVFFNPAGQHEFKSHCKILFGLVQNLDFFTLMVYEYANAKEFMQFKFGLEYELPAIPGKKEEI